MTLQIIDARDFKFKHIFSNLVELYLYDISKDANFDLNENGTYGDEDVSDCWSDSSKENMTRLPYLIKLDDKIAGFIIIDKTILLNEKQGFDVGEFFILQKYQKLGIGSKVATSLFNHHKGFWQVRVLNTNTKGRNFWNKYIPQYTKNNFKVEEIYDHRWDGLVYYFENSQ